MILVQLWTHIYVVSPFYVGYDYHPFWGLVVIGGRTEDNYPSYTAEATDDGFGFDGSIPRLPIAVEMHCMAIVDAETFFVAGGVLDGEGGMLQGLFDQSVAKQAFLYRKKNKCGQYCRRQLF